MTALKKKKSIHLQRWPEYNPKLLVRDTVQMPVQVNGKVRDVITVPVSIREDDAVFAARKSEHVARYLEGATIRKVIFIPGKLLNLVLG
jgi:leucyl-tRNA synthetase